MSAYISDTTIITVLQLVEDRLRWVSFRLFRENKMAGTPSYEDLQAEQRVLQAALEELTKGLGGG